MPASIIHRFGTLSSLNFEVAIDKRRHVILVISAGRWFALSTLVNDVLKEAVLLRADFFQDLWQHFMHLLGLRLADDAQDVLAHRVRDYAKD